MTGPRTSAAPFSLGAPPRRVTARQAVHVVLGDFGCWFGAVFSIPLAFVPLATGAGVIAAVALAVFPACGVTLFVLGARKGRRGLRLLRAGVETTGTFVDEHPTGAAINDAPVMRMRFRFRDAAGRAREAIAKTHETGALRDQRDEPLLYDPAADGDAMLLDDLPGRPRVQGDAVVVTDRSTIARAWFALLVAAVVALGTAASIAAALGGARL